MQLRPARPEDVPSLIDLFVDAIRVLGAQQYDEAQRAAWSRAADDRDGFGERLSAMHVLLAEQDGLLLGFLGYFEDGHMDFLYTAPAAARRGVATALHRQVEATLRAAGVTELYTEASLVARPFFEAQGYRVTEEEVLERQGVQLRRFRMRKPLA
ncbi:MAG: GNAT family N-acetyltransferase [Deltaproteobacteria bacterium]|nr:GNAT family N-acetyltransferase [Deltaproteobacteria bacterium]